MSPAQAPAPYSLVQVASGAWSVRSLAEGETFHPVVGPAAEAEALYVRQMRLAERAAAVADEFVVWDVGLGAAANVLAVVRALAGTRARLRVESFDHTAEPLRFARSESERLGYFGGMEPFVDALLEDRDVRFTQGACEVRWRFHQGDFPSWLRSPATDVPPPEAILFDAFSPARNPAMWTLEVFQRLRACVGARPATLATYSRSTLLRVTLLRAGFFVGAGHATGEKEETTVAASDASMAGRLLDAAWLERASRSTSAEPLHEPVYRQRPLSVESRAALASHPQFARSH
ncbi:MAG: MnmC family methyltransferase [Verrucomicrobiota bacterium]|jgi:hypothetical protein